MGNKIVDSTTKFLATVRERSPDILTATEKLVTTRSSAMYPTPLSLSDALNQTKAIKYVATIDGFSTKEGTGLRRTLEFFKLPEVFIKHIEEFDVAGCSQEDIAALFPAKSMKAKFFIDGLIFVALQDDFSKTERAATVSLAERLGLRPEIVPAYEARIRLDIALAAHGNAELIKLSEAVDAAQWSLS